MIFQNKKLIVCLSRKVIKTYLFSRFGKKPKETGQYQLAPDNLEEILSKVKKENKGSKIRVLLSEDLGYLLEMEIPLDIKEERDFISQAILEKIPERLDDKDWDFVEIGKNEKSKIVRVFTPVKGIWENFAQVALKVGLEIEAVETEGLARKRNEDPITGLALKKDLRGKDEEVLNIIPSGVRTEEEESETDGQSEEKPKQKNKTWLKFVLIGIAILLIAGAAYYFLKYNKKSSSLSSIPEITPAVSESPTPTPGFDLKTLKIQILNGSGTPGEASKVKEYLQVLDYGEIETGNADAFDYTNLNLGIKESRSEYKNRLIDDLSKKYKLSPTIDVVDKEDKFDVIIIIGKEQK